MHQVMTIPAITTESSYRVVRQYVEGTKNASQLLDLISASGDDIEPTQTVAARHALYPEASGEPAKKGFLI